MDRQRSLIRSQTNIVLKARHESDGLFFIPITLPIRFIIYG
jgi:hypothetical protein